MAGTYKGRSTALGGGGRFAKLTDELAAKGARNPQAEAAAIGRKKYGAAGMAKLAQQGKARKKG